MKGVLGEPCSGRTAPASRRCEDLRERRGLAQARGRRLESDRGLLGKLINDEELLG